MDCNKVILPLVLVGIFTLLFGVEQIFSETIENKKIFETRIGNLTVESGYLTPETEQTLKDELFFQRAIQVYQQAYPSVAVAGIFHNADKINASGTDIIYWSDFISSDIEILTANISVLYLLIMLDLSDGPLVVDVPPGLMGVVNNLYQQVLSDVGRSGPDKGNGGLFLIIPPNYNGSIPENHIVVQSDTTQTFFVGRSFVNNGDKTSAENLIKEFKVYHLSDAADLHEQKFIDLNGQSLKMTHPTTEGFWELLHKVYSNEKSVRDEDKNLIGLMHTIGIIPGQPFEPDEHSKKLLEEAAIVADLMTKNSAYNFSVQENSTYYPNSNWQLALKSHNPNFEDENGITQIEPRLAYTYLAITTADAMVKELLGFGSKYLATFKDADENWLVGSNTYKLNVPPNVPAERFWSVIVYDAETRSLIQNDLQPQPGVSSINAENLVGNDDGSYDIYFGPELPLEGYENNWIKTNEGEGFFTFFRFYSPTEVYYDKSWQLPNIELVR
ncbi:MAG: DUF1254 domain-containing protein [Nitrososphaeraceae archaeon]